MEQPDIQTETEKQAVLEAAIAAKRAQLRKDPSAPQRSRGRPSKAAREEIEQAEVARKQFAALATILAGQWAVLLSALAGSPVRWEGEEEVAVAQALQAVAEQYLPDGSEKHLPLIALVAISGNAVLRARSAKAAARSDAEE